jgi:hypothetical protein
LQNSSDLSERTHAGVFTKPKPSAGDSVSADEEFRDPLAEEPGAAFVTKPLLNVASPSRTASYSYFEQE